MKEMKEVDNTSAYAIVCLFIEYFLRNDLIRPYLNTSYIPTQKSKRNMFFNLIFITMRSLLITKMPHLRKQMQ